MRSTALFYGLLLAAGIWIGIADAHAQLYVGADAGGGFSRDGQTYTADVTARAYPHAWKHESGQMWGVHAGYRYGHVAAELGYLKLPNYLAYAEGTEPTRSTVQTITAHSYYARANVYGPATTLQPYAFVGVAKTFAKSHEEGMREGVHDEFDISIHSFAPYAGIGVQYKLARLEAGYIHDAYKSFWSGERSYAFVNVGLEWKF